MPIRERILSMGITGSGKSYQWLKLADILLPTKARFRCLDTDNDIPYMLETQFPQLLPRNGGNVYVHAAIDWPDYKLGVAWLQRKPINKDYLELLTPDVRKDLSIPIKDQDWVVVDMADNAWDTVQRYFTSEVFGEDLGDYFLQMRKLIQQRGGKDRHGKVATSVAPEAFDGWKDWSVMNKLYYDWIHPIVYQIPCHVYATTRPERIDKAEKNAEILSLFGGLGVRPAGQKKLGGQMHTIFLMIPGEEKWFITTAKDRAGRPYFKKTPLVSLYMQYLVAKANWPMI
ncbi:unnamed protein product [marine sediment metagenome]|uniref:Uncharacterized protein n=1 Tax=marine sediment metagenome TaxID=412755 RepID=X1S4E5_9ZZZZ